MSKISLYVVYEEKDLARRYGGFYNPDLISWQCEENNNKCIEKYRRVYLEIDYDKKEYVKSLDGKWDSDLKQWYCSTGHKILIEEFLK